MKEGFLVIVVFRFIYVRTSCSLCIWSFAFYISKTCDVLQIALLYNFFLLISLNIDVIIVMCMHNVIYKSSFSLHEIEDSLFHEVMVLENIRTAQLAWICACTMITRKSAHIWP